jgi:hypothetical protein
MRKIENLKTKLIITLLVLAFAVVLYVFKIPCPILAFTGLPCFGCGMTRALVWALQLNFAAAFSCHFMFPSVPFLYLCFLYDGKLFKNKIFNIVFYIVIITGFLLNWLLNFLY